LYADAGAKKNAPKLSQAKPKPKPKGLLKKLLRFTKPIPFLGTAIAAGTAIYSAQDGYRNADEILEKDQADLTELDRLATAAGALVNDVSFGVLSTRGTAEKIIEWVDSEEKDRIIEKYQNELGIIDYDTIGDSEIEDWDKFYGLSSREMEEIISLDDWDEDDLVAMEQALEQRMDQEASTPSKSKASIDLSTESARQSTPPPMPYSPTSVKSNGKPVGSTSSLGNTGGSYTGPMANQYDYVDPTKAKGEEAFNISGGAKSTGGWKWINPDFKHNLLGMGLEYKQLFGEKMNLYSAGRSIAYQKKLYEQDIANNGGTPSGMVASPGGSMHNYGMAVDISTPDVNKADKAGLLEKWGIHRPLYKGTPNWETWHLEPTEIWPNGRRKLREDGKKLVGKGANVDQMIQEGTFASGLTARRGDDQGVAFQPKKVEGSINLSEESSEKLESTASNTPTNTPSTQNESSGAVAVSTSGAQGISEGETPTKAAKELVENTTNPNSEQINKLKTSISGLQSSIKNLQAKKQQAEKSGESKKVKNIQTAITSYEKSIQTLTTMMEDLRPGSSAEIVKKSDVEKDKAIVKVEDNYKSTINNTQSYDRGNATFAAQTTVASINNINSVSGAKSKSTPNALQIFDK